jgi:hypothetical protein
MLINYLYPEMEERWKVQNMGTFYRNYNRDVLTYDEENAEIQVARDGFQKLLPQGMLFTTRNKNHEDLKNSINEQNAKMRLLRDLFQPFDTFAFRRRLAVERQISQLLDTSYTICCRPIFTTTCRKKKTHTFARWLCFFPLLAICVATSCSFATCYPRFSSARYNVSKDATVITTTRGAGYQ